MNTVRLAMYGNPMEITILVVGFVVLVGSLALYFLPAIIALGWVAALVWAFTTPRSSPNDTTAPQPYGAMRTCQH